MSFTYTGNPASSPIDSLRFVLGDTNPDAAVFQDAELQYIVDTTVEGSSRLAVAFRHAATTFGIRAVKRTLGPQHEDPTARLNFFVDMAKYYERLTSYSGTPPLPDYQSEKVFDRGMMANEE